MDEGGRKQGLVGTRGRKNDLHEVALMVTSLLLVADKL